MRQQLLTKPSASSDRSIGRRQRREQAALKSSPSHASTQHLSQPAAQRQQGITVTPIRGFFISLMFLAPMASLGVLCFALVKNNLKLHQQNDKLAGMANEVTAEIDTLSEEIEALRERAGVEPVAEEISLASRLRESRPIEEAGESLPPRGGVASEIDALDLLKDAKAQVPKLNRALDSAAKPLEKTLAAEAAYPDGFPLTGHLEVSSEFGIRNNPFGGSGYEVHKGIDFVGDEGDIIAATGEGKVTLAGANGGYGNSVVIDHGYGYETLYAHMSKVGVKVGDRVKRGQVVGRVGSTGRSSGAHLHYSVYKNDKAIDPRQLMSIPENVLAIEPR